MNKWLSKFLPEMHDDTTDSLDGVNTLSKLSVGSSCDIATLSTVSVRGTAIEWIYNNPPPDSTIYNCAYCSHEFDFSKDSIIAVGGVYCCHFGGNNDHLQPYLESRLKEAAVYL